MSAPKSAKPLDQELALTKKGQIYLVLQEGGSSSEHYPSFYNTLRQALKGVAGHRKATYNCTEPIPTAVFFDKHGTAHIREDEAVSLIEDALRGVAVKEPW